jgi:hypothetical protein
MKSHAPSGSLTAAGVVLVVGSGVGTGAWFAARAVDLSLPSSRPPDVPVTMRVVDHPAKQGPTPEEIAAAKESWRQDLELVSGDDVVVVHYDYDAAVDLYALQGLTVAWTRASVDDDDGPRANVVATGTLETERDFIEFAENAIGDRNRNGVPDVLVKTSFMGTAWSSERVRLLEPKDGALVDVLDVPWLQEARWPLRFEDVDADGLDELVTMDITWEWLMSSGGHADGPHAEFVVEFLRGGRMIEDPRSPLLLSQAREEEKELRFAVAHKDETAVLNAAGTLLQLEMNGPRHDVAGALARFRKRVNQARLDDEHQRDAQTIEHRARTVDLERPRAR